MASSTQSEMSEEIAAQLSLEEKESLDEIIKEAESDLESQEVLDQSLAIVAENEDLDKDAAAKFPFYTVAGVFKNQTILKKPLSVMATHIWAGHIIKNFPNPLKFPQPGTFFISNISDFGVEAAVVYFGLNKKKEACGWLLAFVNNKAYGMRIYGECGAKIKFIHIDWNIIREKLHKAPKDVNTHDAATGTSLVATIRPIRPGKAAVAAIFRG